MRCWRGGKGARVVGGEGGGSEELARWERCEGSEVARWGRWENN